jgi:hypothetical protein
VDEQIAANMDGGWKRLMERYFKEFFRFFFPAISRGNRLCVSSMLTFRFLVFGFGILDHVLDRTRTRQQAMNVDVVFHAVVFRAVDHGLRANRLP